MKKNTNIPALEAAHQHFKTHKELFDGWRRSKARIEPDNDFIVPLVKPYEEANPGIDVLTASCRECYIDMLVWYNKEYKKRNETNKV